jgi:hypothetical protein
VVAVVVHGPILLLLAAAAAVAADGRRLRLVSLEFQPHIFLLALVERARLQTPLLVQQVGRLGLINLPIPPRQYLLMAPLLKQVLLLVAVVAAETVVQPLVRLAQQLLQVGRVGRAVVLIHRVALAVGLRVAI